MRNTCFPFFGEPWHAVFDVVLEVGGDAL